jgi:DNA-binding CsgD family transcriptional regulator
MTLADTIQNPVGTLPIQCYREFLDRLPFGTAFLAGDATVIELNQVARRMLSGSTGLRLQGGRLRAHRRDADLEISAALNRCSNISIATDRSPPTVVLPSTPGVPATCAVLLPIQSSAGTWPVASAAALAMLFDCSHREDPPLEMVRAVYGLTHAESGLALALLRGNDMRSAAAKLQISVATARTQLKHIFAKLGCRSQAAMIRMLCLGPLGLWR